jgi:hypothetical protein
MRTDDEIRADVETLEALYMHHRATDKNAFDRLRWDVGPLLDRALAAEAALASLRADWAMLYDLSFTPREPVGDGVADDLGRIAARGRDES